MRTILLLASIALMTFSCTNTTTSDSSLPDQITLSDIELSNKIKGGWAGQVIGCTYGGPTEFRYQGMMISDTIPIVWNSTRMKWYYDNAPGLYDDIYMDLTFVDVFEKKGLDATAQDHGDAFANAEYMLWHANQAARYNILNGINPPESGYWENNPHSDDIDFQIEADFAGLMAPGMPNASNEICDVVGHIMNYGDGYYGGVYVAAMYSLAFVSDDVEYVVNEALKTIPEKSTFHQCMTDVISWHKLYPDNWRTTWQEVEDKWSADIGCPDGVFTSFDIDAKINAAYILIGLLYGEGDYGKTIEVSTRCGQDSDCNPASAAGILGTMIGYDAIPDYWKLGLSEVEDMDFKYTTMSLNDVYEIGLKHAKEVIELNDGIVEENKVTIVVQDPTPVPLEQGFENIVPIERINPDPGVVLNSETTEYSFEFSGTGFVVSGWSQKADDASADMVNKILVTIDGEVLETALMPTSFTTRRHEITWKYNLPEGKHKVSLEILDPQDGYHVTVGWILVYDNIEEN